MPRPFPSPWPAAYTSVRSRGPAPRRNRLSIAAVSASGWAEPTNPLQATVWPSATRAAASVGRAAPGHAPAHTHHPPLTWMTWPVT